MFPKVQSFFYSFVLLIFPLCVAYVYTLAVCIFLTLLNLHFSRKKLPKIVLEFMASIAALHRSSIRPYNVRKLLFERV